MKKSIYFIVFLSLSLSLQAQQVDIVKLYNQAQVAAEMGYLDDAIEMYSKVLEINPQFSKGYLELGNIYLKKGQDVNSLTNASRYFTEYLRLNPNAENAIEVKTSLDRLEFVLKKTSQKEEARDYLLGRWASADGKTDKYGRSSFIFDISEFDNKIRIDIDPSSLCYSADFNYKTVYIDNPNDDQYAFIFTNDKTYLPSQAGYDFNSQVISQASGQIFGNSSAGGWANILGQAINSSNREKDLQKKTITVYELKLNPVSNENRELICKGRIYQKEISPLGEKILLDDVFTTSFYKVNQKYTNRAPIRTGQGLIWYKDNELNKDFWGYDLDEQLKNSWANYDPSTLRLYKKGMRQRNAGIWLNAFGGCFMGTGLFLWSLGSGDVKRNDYMSEEEFEKRKKDAKSMRDFGQIITFSGAGLLIIGIPLHIVGNKNRKKAIDLYNESIYKSLENREETSYLKIGISNNGIGLAYTF